jgi:hypothetical protein
MKRNNISAGKGHCHNEGLHDLRCTKCYNTGWVEEMRWAVHAASIVEKIDNGKSENKNICIHGNLLENCSRSLFGEI